MPETTWYVCQNSVITRHHAYDTIDIWQAYISEPLLTMILFRER